MAVQLTGREGWPPDHTALPEIRHLGNDIKEMPHGTLNAFARTDVELAALVVGKDRQADKEYEAIIRQLMTFMVEDPRPLEVMRAARALERIGVRAETANPL